MNIWNNRSWGPMLLKEVDKPFDSDEYVYEIKFDGYRAIIFASPKEFKIISRNNNDITYLYPELKEIQKLIKHNTIFDGEIVSMEDNKPSFSKLQQRSHIKNQQKINNYSKIEPVTFVCFDILYDNKDLTSLSLLERKNILNKIEENDVFIKSKYFSKGISLFNKIKKMHMEGIVAKKKDSIYEISKRTYSWIKIKNNLKEEFIIGGYEIKKKDISILLGEFKENKLYFVGNVKLSVNSDLYKKVLTIPHLKKSPFIDYDKKAIYLKPTLKCMVRYLERTLNNHLRQPIIEK